MRRDAVIESIFTLGVSPLRQRKTLITVISIIKGSVDLADHTDDDLTQRRKISNGPGFAWGEDYHEGSFGNLIAAQTCVEEA